jgi:hypothetical protein
VISCKGIEKIKGDETMTTETMDIYATARHALHDICDESVANVGEVADRLSIDKLTLIQLARADMKFARLVAAKISPNSEARKRK